MCKVQDLSRLYSRRAEKFDTGIDRVERGIFEEFRKDPNNLFLIRFGRFYFLIPSRGIDDVFAHMPRSRIADYQILKRASVASGYRSIDLAGFDEFWHLGHISHGERFWERVKAQGLQIKILIHDVIALDYPKTCREHTVTNFQVNFDQWTRFADLIVTPSEYSRARVLAHAAAEPKVVVQDLAVETFYDCTLAKAENAFVVIGTIEPRKNHILLLKIWQHLYEALGDQSPMLWIIGKRGWENEEVFEFLDNSPLMNKIVFELTDLTDEELIDHLCRAKSLLMPSIVEGFGLPFYEAILSGRSVLASRIPAFEENLDASSVKKLLSLENIEDWSKKIRYFEEVRLTLKQEPPRNWHKYLELLSKKTNELIE